MVVSWWIVAFWPSVYNWILLQTHNACVTEKTRSLQIIIIIIVLLKRTIH